MATVLNNRSHVRMTILVVMMMLGMEAVHAFFFSTSSSSMSRHILAKNTPVNARLASEVVKMMSTGGGGWDDDQDVRFMSSKHIDTGFLKVCMYI